MAIRSPLGELINSSILMNEDIGFQQLNGRYITSETGKNYLIKAYLERSSGEGTDDGELPSFGNRASSGGGSTSTWLFRGYIMSYCEVPATFKHGQSEDNFRYNSVLGSSTSTENILQIPIVPNKRVSIRHGNLQIIHNSEIVMVGGKYQGLGPDKTIYVELKGVPVVIRGSMVR